MLLQSISFGFCNGVSELPESVLSLFTECVENPSKQVNFASEIVTAGLEGRIYNPESFSIGAYEAAIRKYEMLKKSDRKKKFVSLDISDDMDSDDSGSQEISNSYVSKQMYDHDMRDVYEEVIESDALRDAVASIKALNEDLILDEQLDLVCTLTQATTGEQSDPCVIRATEVLQKFCATHTAIADYIFTILSSGQRIGELFGVSA